MAESALHLSLITPERHVLTRDVTMVVAPAMLGDVGIMAEHAPYLSVLRSGMVTLYNEDNIDKEYFVCGGYINIADNHCTLLAESVTDKAELSRDAIEARLYDLQKQAEHCKDDDAQRDALLEQASIEEAKLACII